MIDINELVITRHKVCKECEHYNDNETCNFLIIKTGRKGRLNHPSGIGNPRARCPLEFKYTDTVHRWNSIPSYHTWYTRTHIVPLTKSEQHLLNRVNLKRFGPIQLTTLCHKYHKQHNTTPPLRSLLLQEIDAIAKCPNDYNYDAFKDIDLVTGESHNSNYNT